MYCCVICLAYSPIHCQMPEHAMKRFYNLQPVYKRPQYIRAKCHAAPEQITSSHVPRQRKLLPLVYKRTTSFRYSTYVENWLYVCTHGGGSFLCLGTWLKVAFSGTPCQFCNCSVAFFESTFRLQNFDTCSADCRLIANGNSHCTWGKRKVLHFTIC